MGLLLSGISHTGTGTHAHTYNFMLTTRGLRSPSSVRATLWFFYRFFVPLSSAAIQNFCWFFRLCVSCILFFFFLLFRFKFIYRLIHTYMDRFERNRAIELACERYEKRQANKLFSPSPPKKNFESAQRDQTSDTNHGLQNWSSTWNYWFRRIKRAVCVFIYELFSSVILFQRVQINVKPRLRRKASERAEHRWYKVDLSRNDRRAKKI